MHIRRRNRNHAPIPKDWCKEQIYFLEKYPELYAAGVKNKIPYPVINRCVIRWLQYRKKHELPYYYPKDVSETCICIRVFIAAYNAEITPDIVDELTKVKIAYDLAEITGFKAWFENMRG